EVHNLLDNLSLHTVCQEAICPNRGECYGRGTATFLLLGPGCTRNCSFCAVGTGPAPVNPEEPTSVAEAVARMGIKYCVLTMVTRDDLPDGGSGHIAGTINEIRSRNPEIRVEVLVSDFRGHRPALETVIQAGPEVLNHNLETVPRLYPLVRPGANYRRSLDLLAQADQAHPRPVTKSGLMLGLGETIDEIVRVMADLRSAGCDVLTLGQFLSPSRRHLPVSRYVPPEEFDPLAEKAAEMGFLGCASGPYVRSSYRAEELFEKAVGSGGNI
ncbi:MAG: lipoyl synthase, partial [Deltaproteobacteria bacterium]|nr:lipoyl synthase [Deltaproteobacteria bacterium]